MKNTVLVESKLRRRLRLACSLLCVLCLMFIAFVVVVVMIDKHNLNGQTLEITGVLSEVYPSDTNTVTIDKDKYYNIVWDDEESNVKMDNYRGKEVTLIVAAETFASNPWAFGLKAEGNTIVDYRETLETKIKENNEMKTVLTVVTAILCAATCGMFIWRFNVTPTVERELYKEFGEFLRDRQPACPQRKYLIVYACIFGIILLALIITGIALDADSDTWAETSVASKVMLIMSAVFAVLGVGGAIAFNEWLARKEIDFYSKNLPFDFSDISHAPLRRKLKEQLQEELKKEYREYPDTYADGGNGYDVTFDCNGVTLTVPFDDENLAQQSEMPNAEEVFADLSATDNSSILINAEGNPNNRLRFSYEEANFEAVAYFRKNVRPMMIIVKSRLDYSDSYPEELVNDIHIPLDSNLLATLNKYNVEVENLQYLLDNKKSLMIENCLTFNKKESKKAK